MSDAPHDIEVRPARIDDLDPVEDFADRVWGRYDVEEGHDPNIDWSSQPVVLLARQDSSIAGIAKGRVTAGVGHLSELLVDPELRSRGIGTALLAEFEARCREAGCHKLSVHTEAEGPARPYYERRGWDHEATFRRDKAGLDFVRLVKFLDT